MLGSIFAVLVTLVVVTNCQVKGPPFDCPSTLPPEAPYDCNCTYAECTWSGDPHQTTFDGFHYHFQGALNQLYRYVSSCTSDETQVPFQVLAKHGICPSGSAGVTCTTQVIIRLYDRTTGVFDRNITVDPGFNVDDSTLAAPVLENDVHFYANGQSFYSRPAENRLEFFSRQLCTTNVQQQFRTPDLIVEDVSTGLTTRNMRVELNVYYLNMTCGLCGFYDGNTVNDFIYSAIAPFSPYDKCLEQTLPSATWMSGYTSLDWHNVDTFGAAWIDFGAGIRRRLEEEENEHPINDPDRRQAALLLGQQLFPEEAERQEFFLDDCADDGQFVCEKITPHCIFQVCQTLIATSFAQQAC